METATNSNCSNGCFAVVSWALFKWTLRYQVIVRKKSYFIRASHQYSTANIKRELNKAYCGFFCNWNPDHAPAIATGKWGCGAFGGDTMLKSKQSEK